MVPATSLKVTSKPQCCDLGLARCLGLGLGSSGSLQFCDVCIFTCAFVLVSLPGKETGGWLILSQQDRPATSPATMSLPQTPSRLKSN